MKTLLQATAALLLVLTAASAAHADTDTDTDKAVQKTIKSLIGAIRYSKDDVAAQQVAFGPMAKALMADDWAKLSSAEQTELTRGIEKLIRTISFPKGRDLFKYLDAMLYDTARVEGDKARAKSTVVIHRDLKKTEVVIEWVLIKDGGGWKVLDTVMMGESTLDGLREDQMKPLLAKGGTQAVLAAVRERVAEVEKK